MGADQPRQPATAFVSSPAVSLGQRAHSEGRLLPQLQFLDFLRPLVLCIVLQCQAWIPVLCLPLNEPENSEDRLHRISGGVTPACTWDFCILSSLRS